MPTRSNWKLLACVGAIVMLGAVAMLFLLEGARMQHSMQAIEQLEAPTPADLRTGFSSGGVPVPMILGAASAGAMLLLLSIFKLVQNRTEAPVD